MPQIGHKCELLLLGERRGILLYDTSAMARAVLPAVESTPWGLLVFSCARKKKWEEKEMVGFGENHGTPTPRKMLEREGGATLDYNVFRVRVYRNIEDVCRSGRSIEEGFSV